MRDVADEDIRAVRMYAVGEQMHDFRINTGPRW